MSGQWQRDGSGRVVGLHAADCLALIALVTDDKERQRQLWRELKCIAQGVMQAIDESQS